MILLDQRFPDKKQIGLAVCCDWHLGSQTCDTKAVAKWVDIIKKNKWYVLLLGDLTENATISSVGSVYEQILTPQEQIFEVVRLLEPIKDYIIGSVLGNHSNRSVKIAGLNPDQIIAYELGHPYFNNMVTGRIQVGEAHWIIVGHHGTGGGILMGSKLNMIGKMTKIFPMADLYLAAHAHADVSCSDRVMDVALNKGKVNLRWKVRHLSGCGSLLEYGGSYAEAKLMPPAALCQVVHMLGDRINRKGDSSDPGAMEKSYDRHTHWF